MRISFPLRLAWREGRASLSRVGVYMLSITLGVAALVAVHSFRGDLSRSIQDEARTLLGGDVRLESQSALPALVRHLADSVLAEGGRTAEATTLISMVLAPGNDLSRLLQVRGVSPENPLFGELRESPAGAWGRLSDGGMAVVDPAVLTQLELSVGDTLQVGDLQLEVAGSVEGLPADVGFQTAVGPRVYLSLPDLRATGLLGFGSLARRQLYLEFPDPVQASDFRDRYREALRAESVSLTTAEEQAASIGDGLEVMSRFLGLVGLMALLLGGIGVASAIHVYVREKLTAVAVLRCLGARQRSVFSAYLLQAAGLGLMGSALGVLLGVGLQATLPRLLSDLLPVQVRTVPAPEAMVTGLAIGVWVSVIFALLPLLAIRDVSPLGALRREVEPQARKGLNLPRLVAFAALATSVVVMSLWQAPSGRAGLYFAAGLGGAVLLLWATALLLIRVTRRLLPLGASFPVRQGVSNLFRPRNQTVPVILSLGFGTFLIGTVLMVESNLVERLTLAGGSGERANLLLFDIQASQRSGVEELISAVGGEALTVAPIVPARIAGVRGRSVEELLADSTGGGASPWALRRVYRNTYRAARGPAEEVVAGEWWDGALPQGESELPRISMEAELARDLGIAVGDEVEWDVQGVRIRTRVSSLRYVEWARFEPNFFVVFEPGVLEDAPGTFLALVRVPEPEVGAELQRRLVRAYPNVSLVDLVQLRETLEAILDKVVQAIRFLAGFSVVGGILVLAGALATSRFQRMREMALLRTLGARRSQLLRVLITEYLALGLIAGLAGTILGGVAGWLVVESVFEQDFRFPAVSLMLLLAGVASLALVLGSANSRGILVRAPLPVLREATE